MGESEEGEEEAEQTQESGVEELEAGGDSSMECDPQLPKSSDPEQEEGEGMEQPATPPADEGRQPEHPPAESAHTHAEASDLGEKPPPESTVPETIEEDIVTGWCGSCL